MATMEKIKGKIIILSICAIVSLSSGANIEESQQNKIEEDTPAESDAATRNARYISHQGNPYYYQNTGTGGYYYPNTNRDRDYYYPSNRYPVVNQYPGGGNTQLYPERYPNKFDPSYWLSKLPGFGNTGSNYPRPTYPNPNYPNPNYPNYIPGTGTDFIGYNPYPSRYPGGSGYPHTTYPQSGYPGYSGSGTGYIGPGYTGTTGAGAGYPGVSGIGSSGSGYAGQHGHGGYGGYQGNGGLTSYSGYDGYYAAGNRPGNIGFGYQNSRTNGIIGTSGRYPNALLPIATPSTVSKDAK